MSNRPLPADAMYMLGRYFLHGVLLELRALHDRDPTCLGIGQISKRLGDDAVRHALHAHLDRFPRATMMTGNIGRERCLSYVHKYAQILAAKVKSATYHEHPLAAKVQLVRHMANKEVAHSTLDEYQLAGQDLHDVVVATMIIACAIDAALSEVATGHDLAGSESAGKRAAGLVLHREVDDQPYMSNMISSFLPGWVETGQEGPVYPDGFTGRGLRSVP